MDGGCSTTPSETASYGRGSSIAPSATASNGWGSSAAPSTTASIRRGWLAAPSTTASTGRSSCANTGRVRLWGAGTRSSLAPASTAAPGRKPPLPRPRTRGRRWRTTLGGARAYPVSLFSSPGRGSRAPTLSGTRGPPRALGHGQYQHATLFRARRTRRNVERPSRSRRLRGDPRMPRICQPGR